MNCEQANKTPLETVLKSMGYKALGKHSGGSEQWYENPLRTERTPSFSVNHKKNLWQDLGTGEGGSVIDLVMAYDNTNVSGALQWLRNNLGSISLPKKETPYSPVKYEEKKQRYELTKTQRILTPSLKQYLKGRNIPLNVANEHLKEVRYMDTETGKNYYGLGLANDSNGYNVRNKYMKTILGKTGITAIYGQVYSARVNVFEGVFDFLTHTTMNKQIKPSEHAIILNSTNLANRAVNLIKREWRLQNTDVCLWLDNQIEGSNAAESVERAIEHFKELSNRVYSANTNYSEYEDLNAYWVATNKPLMSIVYTPLNFDVDMRLEM